MRTPSSSPRRLLARAGVLLAVVTGLAVVYSCSLIVETRSQQCQSDTDCANITGYPRCDTVNGVCVAMDGGSTSSSSGSSSSSSSTSSSGAMSCDVDGGIDGGGCYDKGLAACTGSSNSQILNACTTGCIPFDDTSVKGLLAGGALPPLPAPPDGGL